MVESYRDGPDTLRVPFIFVKHGDPPPLEWMARHPGWVKFPAVMIPRDSPRHPANGGAYPTFPPQRPEPPPHAEPEAERWPFGKPVSHGASGSMSRLTPCNPPRYPGGHGAPPGSVEAAAADPVAVFLRTNAYLDRVLGRAKPAPQPVLPSIENGNLTQYVPASLRPPPFHRLRDHGLADPHIIEIGRFTSNVDDAKRGLRMSEFEFRDAIHKLKRGVHIGARDNLLFEIPSGNVFFNGECIGNLYDED